LPIRRKQVPFVFLVQFFLIKMSTIRFKKRKSEGELEGKEEKKQLCTPEEYLLKKPVNMMNFLATEAWRNDSFNGLLNGVESETASGYTRVIRELDTSHFDVEAKQWLNWITTGSDLTYLDGSKEESSSSTREALNGVCFSVIFQKIVAAPWRFPDFDRRWVLELGAETAIYRVTIESCTPYAPSLTTVAQIASMYLLKDGKPKGHRKADPKISMLACYLDKRSNRDRLFDDLDDAYTSAIQLSTSRVYWLRGDDLQPVETDLEDPEPLRINWKKRTVVSPSV